MKIMEHSLARTHVEKAPKVEDLVSLKGKVALVSGGTYGLGYAVAYRYLSAGARTVITGRNEEKGQRAVDEFKDLGFGDNIAFVKCDVTSVADCYAAVAFAEKTYGKVDILANIAAAQTLTSFLDISEADYDKMLDTNLKGTFFMSQAVCQSMVRNKIGGYIVNCSSIGSVGADNALCMLSHYSASKAGVNGLTIAVAREMAQYGIHCNCVACGSMNTEGQNANSPALYQRYGADLAVFGQEPYASTTANAPVSKTPDDMARMFFVLSTPFADHMLGETVFVDGGHRFYSMVPKDDISRFAKGLKEQA